MFKEEQAFNCIIGILTVALLFGSHPAIANSEQDEISRWAAQIDSRHQHEIATMRKKILARLSQLNLPTEPTSAVMDEYEALDIRPGW